MNQSKISVIVTSYKNEKVLMRCLESIINQKEISLDIIVVDSAKSFFVKDLCDYLSKELYATASIHDLEYISVENRLAGYARQEGLKRAKADLIHFIDGDDYLCSDRVYAVCMKYFNFDVDDMIMFDYNLMPYQPHNRLKMNMTGKNDNQFIWTEYDINDINTEVWNKIFVKEKISSQFNIPDIKFEDVYSLWDYLLKTNGTIKYIPVEFYTHTLSENTIMGNVFRGVDKSYEQLKDIKDKVLKLYEELFIQDEGAVELYKSQIELFTELMDKQYEYYEAAYLHFRRVEGIKVSSKEKK